MRLWSLHPSLLDSKGLVAAWREALLAKAVLEGNTRGYQSHSQLQRFRAHAQPVAAIHAYLAGLHQQSLERGYRFDASKFKPAHVASMDVSEGQLQFELEHLRVKLQRRAPAALAGLPDPDSIPAHPLFTVSPGPVADWERGDSSP